MRLTTILDPRYPMALGERLNRLGELAAMKATRLVPRRVRYWVFIQEGSRAMLPDQVVPDARFMDLLERVPR